MRPVVAALEFIQPRSPAKLGREHHQGIFEQPAFVHVGDQGGERLVGAAHHDPMANAVAALAARFVPHRPAGTGRIDQIGDGPNSY
jgi:hypothetical protein